MLIGIVYIFKSLSKKIFKGFFKNNNETKVNLLCFIRKQ